MGATVQIHNVLYCRNNSFDERAVRATRAHGNRWTGDRSSTLSSTPLAEVPVLELLFFELRSFDSFELNAFPVSLKGCFLSVT